jgi:hypothetical protein
MLPERRPDRKEGPNHGGGHFRQFRIKARFFTPLVTRACRSFSLMKQAIGGGRRRDRGRKKIENPTTLVVHWPASKMTVAGFTRAAFDYECAHNRAFFFRASRGGDVEGLLYDLGHEGRELQDFPSRMSLTVPQPSQESVAWRPDQPNLVASMQLSQLYDQLTDAVERYIIETYRKRERGRFAPGPDVFQRAIDALRALADHAKEKLVTVTFTPVWDELHRIKKMEGQGYRYEDR